VGGLHVCERMARRNNAGLCLGCELQEAKRPARAAVGAFRCERRESGILIEKWHDSAAELLDLSKRVCFTAFVGGRERLANAQLPFGWGELPLRSASLSDDLIEETCKCHASIADTGTRTDRGVEGGGIAFVLYLDRHRLRRTGGVRRCHHDHK